MQITRLLIENFRSIRKLEVELGESTVLIGRNNAGKTAVLDALRIALTRRWSATSPGKRNDRARAKARSCGERKTERRISNASLASNPATPNHDS